MSIRDDLIQNADFWAFVIGDTDAFSSGTGGLPVCDNTVEQLRDPVFASTAAAASWGATTTDDD